MGGRVARKRAVLTPRSQEETQGKVVGQQENHKNAGNKAKGRDINPGFLRRYSNLTDGFIDSIPQHPPSDQAIALGFFGKHDLVNEAGRLCINWG